MLKIAICDDNREVVRQLSKVITEDFSRESSIAAFFDALSLEIYVEDTAKGDVDILFLDIVLNDRDGIDLARRISENYPQIKIIFITGYIEYARRIFEVNPVYFLVKPIERDMVLTALAKACDLIDAEDLECIQLSTKNGIVNLKLSRLKFIESYNKTVLVHEAQTVWETRTTLNEIESSLPGNFLRCHQSCIVNMHRIRQFRPDAIELYSGEILPVSRSKQKAAKRKFLDYLGDTM